MNEKITDWIDWQDWMKNLKNIDISKIRDWDTTKVTDFSQLGERDKETTKIK